MTGVKTMGYRYMVLGAGRQGVAAAYDLAKNGTASEVVLGDVEAGVAKSGAERINDLLAKNVASHMEIDAADEDRLTEILSGVDTVVSGVHYPLNPGITRAAIAAGTNMCDMGGNTDVVRGQLALSDKAERADITIVPDCGMGPGMNISLAVYAMSLLDNPREVLIWDGGLPQTPESPWNYALTFNIGGLTNEYYGDAYFLRSGKVTPVRCFSDYELIDFAEPLGRLEAFVTSGGLSTAPWTFEGKLERLENKTLRYPGHWAQFRSFSELGLLELTPVRIGCLDVVPRDVLHTLLGPRIVRDDVRDVCVIRVRCTGRKGGRSSEVIVELVDYFDEETGFTGMQRLTGWHTSIVAILATEGRVHKGAVPVELAVPGPAIVEEARKRGLSISVKGS
jgi:lysine 6-dehydrogenase